jgi:hypothetical protein
MIEKFIALVKRQIAYYEGQVTYFTPDHPRYKPDKLALYKKIAAELRELLDFLVELRDERMTSTQDTPARATTSPDRRISHSDLSDLPPELLAELSDAAKGEIDPLIQIIDDRGGTASLDEILIDLYRKHKEIGKRNIISNRLYRLARRGLCWSVPGKKGVYSTSPYTVDLATLPGEDEQEDEGPDGEPSEPSSESNGGSRSPESPSKANPVGSSPTTSTKRHRDLLASSAIPGTRVPR